MDGGGLADLRIQLAGLLGELDLIDAEGSVRLAAGLLRRTEQLLDELRRRLEPPTTPWPCSTPLPAEGDPLAARVRTLAAAVLEAERPEVELEAVFAAVQDGLLLCDPQGRVRRTNDTARRLLDLPEDDAPPLDGGLYGPSVTRLDHTALAADESPLLVARQGEPCSCTLIVPRRDGTERTLLVHARPVTVGERSTGALATLTDLTDQRRVQQERDLLLRTLAHDLRSPLTLIQGHSQLLERQCELPDSPPALLQQRARAIAKNVQRMGRMLDELGELARLEQRSASLQRRPVDAAAFVADLLARHTERFEPNRIEWLASPGLPWAQADPDALERVLLELLRRAVQASPPDRGVRIALKPEAPRAVRIAITDQGPRPPTGELASLFELGTCRRSSDDGLGLGLYLARLLAEAQGGRLGASEGEAVGTTVWLTLPAAGAAG